MMMKRIVFAKPCVTEIWEEEVKPPRKGTVQVKVAVSTISSGTERANLVGDPSVGWNCPPQEVPQFPRFLGYSCAGVVTAIGEGVTSLAVGDRVAGCWCTHSQYVELSEENAHKIDDLSFEEAAMFNIASFPLAAIRKSRLELGESAIVMGMGILGLIALPLLRTAGATPIIAVDPVPEKREKALASGADYALDPYAPDFAKTVKELTGGGANVGIEVTGVGKGLDGILDCMARFGRVALLGCTRRSDFTIDYYRKVHGPGITLIGAHSHARPERESAAGWFTHGDDIRSLIKLAQGGRIHLAEMIDETHSPAEAPEVYERLANERSFPLVQFDWRDFE